MNLFIKIFCCYKNVPYLCVYKRTFFETISFVLPLKIVSEILTV